MCVRGQLGYCRRAEFEQFLFNQEMVVAEALVRNYQFDCETSKVVLIGDLIWCDLPVNGEPSFDRSLVRVCVCVSCNFELGW